MNSEERVNFPSIYTIPADDHFLDVLTKGIIDRYFDDKDPFGLAHILVLLPTRRSCRALQDAFLRYTDGGSVLLPRMIPIGDIDEGHLQIDTLATDIFSEENNVLPAVSDMRRRLILSQLIQQQAQKTTGTILEDKNLPTDRAIRLAFELSSLLNQVQNEQLGFENLAKLVPDDYAAHWQITLQFLNILTEEWPKRLVKERVIDPAHRRNLLMQARAKIWQNNPPKTPIIAAGSTGSIPATADLLSIVAQLPKGSVVLPGLDREISPDMWGLLEPSHPQFGFRQLLLHLDVEPIKVKDWIETSFSKSYQKERVKLVSAALRPAKTTSNWSEIKNIRSSALTGLTRIDCVDSDEEAGVIALIMRNVLTEGNTNRNAALVTPDRELARRVAAALTRWNLEVDDSGGIPLANTPEGTYFRLIIKLIFQETAPLPFLSALKHPLAAGGLAPAIFRKHIRDLEIALLRGPRRKPSLAALANSLRLQANTNPELSDAADALQNLVKYAEPLIKVLSKPSQNIRKIIDEHIQFAENIAKTDTLSGPERLWSSNSGESLAKFIIDFIESSEILGNIKPAHYPSLIDALMHGYTVRPKYGGHPRLAILSPLEARLQHYDTIILGGLNEGTWPSSPSADPWMSRPMRATFGLPQPERKIGLSAHDFSQAMGTEEVYLTRAERVSGSPSVAARWLTRLEFAATSIGLNTQEIEKKGKKWLEWQRALNLALPKEKSISLASEKRPPRPKPPVEVRPRRLSVTDIEQWMRDPYSIYARHILKLTRLKPIDQEPNNADFGSLIHATLEKFLSRYPSGPLPPDSYEKLLSTGKEIFSPIIEMPAVWAFWWPRFERIAGWIIKTELLNRKNIKRVFTETKGNYIIRNLPHGNFEIVAKADRIEQLNDGTLKIIDYKTGSIPNDKEVFAGFSPQLPLEAVIAINGGFHDLPPAKVSKLEFWKITGGKTDGKIHSIGSNKSNSVGTEEIGLKAQNGLIELITAFDNPETPYESRPRVDFAPTYSDYEHLARIKEWSIISLDSED